MYDLEITIKFDDDSSQTGWYISQDETIILDRPPGYFSGNDTATIMEMVRLEAGQYTFTVLDTEGNGFCCEQGLGFYSLYAN